MHLVTREAMALYARHLAPDGVIVFQATNRYIDLLPVVKRLATEVGMEAVLVSDVPAGDDNGPAFWLSSTDQILVTRNRRLLESDALRYVATPIADRADLATFTDAHHNRFRILKSAEPGARCRFGLPASECTPFGRCPTRAGVIAS
jgi:hypothetical protein